MVGCLAVSKAGHDKDEIYLIIKEEKDSIYLADGKRKTVSVPKKKNKKHIQIIKHGPVTVQADELKRKLIDGQPVQDEEIKYVIKQYQRKSEV
ncbi:MAG: KOW domain-containing RNA-binding protein [Lachnospiraceae bacterium]|nr:KOW domain-containing RNA-binding protein [Lachnospiraceae bacterium]